MMFFREWWSVIRLAGADFMHEWRLSLCFVLALASVLAPLFILFGLKYGLVATITTPAIENPQFRRITPIGAGHFTPEWFEHMRERPEVAFIIPRTRSIAATITVRNPALQEGVAVDAELIPSAASDPALPAGQAIPTDLSSVVVSNPLATKLALSVGDRLQGIVTRTMDGKRERGLVTLQVTGIAPERAFERMGLFSSVDLLLAVEHYRDGNAVKALDWPGRSVEAETTPNDFASYRLYAASLDDVAPLRDLLRAQGLEVRTRVNEIETMRSLDRNLTFIFWVIAAIGGSGFLLSLGASLWGYVERKKKPLSILRLMGVHVPSLVWFPIFNAILTSLFGALIAVGAALAIAAVLNDVFVTSGAPGEFACRLLPQHLLFGIGITVLSAIVTSLLAAYRSTLIEPAEGLREV